MRVGTGHIEAVVVTGCEAIHRVMLVDLYGHPDAAAEELHRVTSEMIADVPSPVFQVQRGFGAQLFGDEREHARCAAPLRTRARRAAALDDRATTCCGSSPTPSPGRVPPPTPPRCYRALLPYAGLLNVGGGHSAGLPVDDVLGRLAALDGDIDVRHPLICGTPWRSPGRCPRHPCWSTASTTWPTPSNAAATATGSRRPCAPRPRPSRSTCGVLRTGRQASADADDAGSPARRRCAATVPRGCSTHRSAKPGCPTATV